MKFFRRLGHGNHACILIQIGNSRLVQLDNVPQMRSTRHRYLRSNPAQGIGKEENYDYIFDAEGPVLYANEKYDISDYILEELQKDITSQ